MRNLVNTMLFYFAMSQIVFGQGFVNIAKEYSLNFSYATEEYGGGVSFVDFNQDGLDDLSFATEKGKVCRFFASTGSGFTDMSNLIEDESDVKQILWVDFNNDGHLDLYLASGDRNRLFMNTGDLQLTDVTSAVELDFPSLLSYSSVWFDYDNDGRLDLLVAHRTADQKGSIDLYRNKDYSSFEKVTTNAGLNSTGESVLAMTTLDYNNDGWQDVFLGQDWEKGNVLLENLGNGAFRDVSVKSGVDFKMNSMTGTTMDINEDGWPDLYVSNTTMGNVLLLNDGNGVFEEKARHYGLDLTNVTFGTVFFDADNDGDNDMHVGGLRINHTFEKLEEENTFEKRKSSWGLSYDNESNNGVAIGDYNNDGFIDIVKNGIALREFIIGEHSLWENRFSQGNYIKVGLQGSVSNNFGIGAKLVVHANGKRQHKTIGCGESFSSQHSLTQHFGIGENQEVDSIVVYWPSQNVSVVYDIPANQRIVIEEPPYGCTDETACNYNPNALFDNGSCRYASTFYDCIGCISDLDGDGVCDELEILGCNEENACNYDAEVTENDGSCVFLAEFNIEGPIEYEALEIVHYAYPKTSGSSYEWVIENGSILAGNGSANISVIWYEKDEGELYVKEVDESGCHGAWVQLNVKINAANELAQRGGREELVVFGPNPVDGELYFYQLDSISLTLSLFGPRGQLMRQDVISRQNNTLNLSEMQAGMYFMVFKDEERTYVEKIIKR